jgi:energy-dependent translational throttle protein EttA
VNAAACTWPRRWRKGGNVLMLDEPSNDLDVETLRALEEALLEFAGSAMVISHDRWFLDRICTHILAAEGDSQWVFFNGNYQEYEADKKKRLGEEGARPKALHCSACGFKRAGIATHV